MRLAWPAPLTAAVPLAAFPPDLVLDGSFWVLFFPWILIATVRALAADDRRAIRYPAALLVALYPLHAAIALAAAAL